MPTSSAPRHKTKTLPHLMLSTLLYAPQPWIRRRVDHSAGVIRVDVVSARLRDRMATSYTRLYDYVQWLVDRRVARSYTKGAGLLHIEFDLPRDHG